MITEDQNISFKSIMYDFYKSNKFLCISYIILACMFPLKNVVIPHYIGKLSKAVTQKKDVLKNCFIIFIFAVFLQVINVFLELIDITLFPKMQLHIRDLLLTNIFNSTSGNFSEVENSNIISQIIRFPYVVYGHITSWIENYIPAIVTVIATGLYLLFVNFYIGVVFIFVFSIIIFIFYISFKGCKKISEKRDRYLNDIFSHIDDTMNNLKTVLSFNMQQEEIRNINSSHPEYAELSHKSVVCSLRNKYLVMTLFGYVILLTLCAYFTKVKLFGISIQIEKTVFITISIILYTIFTLLERINWQFKDSIFKWGTIENILNTFNKTFSKVATDVQSESNDINEEGYNEMGIRLSNVNFSYDKKHILKDISIFFPHKKRTLIVGEIGSGKTTLINIIMKYYKIDSGSIFLNGMSYRNLSIHDVRKYIGYLPQNPILFNRSIYENIAFGLPNISKENVLQKFKDLNIESFISNFSDGLDTIVGINGSNLSGGQKQIIWIIKIALMDPEYIILDEPTASLDPESKKIIYVLIKRLIHDKTVIMITHDQYLYDIADHIITLDNGSVVSI